MNMPTSLCGSSLFAAIGVLAASTVVASTAQIDGVLALTPVEEHSCIAVEIRVSPGQPVSGISWYHNDAQVLFPRLLLLEGQDGMAPDLGQTAVVLADLSGSSLEWGSVTLDPPVTTSTGIIQAVFELPAWTERTGTGPGGGPGLGYSLQPGGGNAWVTRDGADWIRVHEDYRVSVEAASAAGRTLVAPQSLTDLAADAPTGWWSSVKPTEIATKEELQPDEESLPRARRDRPLIVAPNPFNPRTEVFFYVEQGGAVSIDVFDLRGRLVSSLLDQTMASGPYSVVWEGTDRSNRRVASGVYLIRLQTPQRTEIERVALVR